MPKSPGDLPNRWAACASLRATTQKQREAGVFATGVERLFAECRSDADRNVGAFLAATAILGIVGAIVMLMGTRQIMAGKITLGDYFTYTMFLASWSPPVFQVVECRHATH